MLGARPLAAGARHHAAAGAAGDRGRPCARAARDAQRHRRQRISRRADADAVDLHHLAQPRQPAGRGADRLLHAGDRGRADRARTLRPAAARLRASPRRTPALRPRIALDGARAMARDRAPASLPVVLGFLLPAGYLAHEVIARGLLVGFDPSLLAHALTTVALAAMRDRDRRCCSASRRSRRCAACKRPLVAACVNIAGIGYAMPGHGAGARPAVAAGRGRRGAQRGSRARSAARSVGLVLAGSSAALVIAYVDPLSRDRDRLRAGRVRPHLARIRRRRPHARRRAGDAGAHDPSAAAAAGDLGRGAAGVRRLPEGTAGDAAAAAAQCRDAVDLHLSVRHPRQFRGRRARRAASSSRSASCR